uniref:Uncharacterized protein n=1 Tax=Rhizophora mucronata TaxID=61149 RepID=A0A2P2PUW3_RHIMU
MLCRSYGIGLMFSSLLAGPLQQQLRL